MEIEETINTPRILSRFKSNTGEVPPGGLLDIPLNLNVDQLQQICRALLKDEENTPFAFYVHDKEITTTLEGALKDVEVNAEHVLEIIYHPQAVFKVRAVTRCTSSLPGHSEPVISVSFSPDGHHLASGSGDSTVRLWDVHTQTPHHVCKGHKNWVLCISWSPDSSRLASGCKNGQIMLWDPVTGSQMGKTLTGHKQWITALCWEPYHSNPECRRLASSSKDCDIRIWDVVLCQTLLTLSGHAKSVSSVKWGGTGLIYTGSQDRTVKVWRASDILEDKYECVKFTNTETNTDNCRTILPHCRKNFRVLCRTLEGHAHWVNTLALSTDYVLRTGPFDPIFPEKHDSCKDKSALQKLAQDRYDEVHKNGGELLVSGSDDFTLFLWTPEVSKKLVERMTGHQQLVNDVKFSPDMMFIASASFDKSIKLWHGQTGRFIASLRGHVQAVYQVSWAADSRLLVSGSADSTLKVWNMKTKKLELDLPGHADEVYAVDWSPDGLRVASGGKDKVLKLWQH